MFGSSCTANDSCLEFLCFYLFCCSVIPCFASFRVICILGKQIKDWRGEQCDSLMCKVDCCSRQSLDLGRGRNKNILLQYLHA